MATEFIKRAQKLGSVIQNIVSYTLGTLTSIGNGLVNVVSDIVRLDFASIPDDVTKAFNGFQSNVDKMGQQFEEGFQLFSTGLDKSLTGTDIPKVGTQQPEQPYEPGLTLSGGAPAAPASANAGYRRIYEAARAAGDPFPEVTAAQWAIESGYGKYQSGKNNPFGQKAGANEAGTWAWTTENINGRNQRVKAKFKDYASEEEAIKFRLQRWGSKYGNARTPEEALRNLQLPTGARIPGTNQTSFGVYATSQTYVQDVSRIIREQGGNPQRQRTVAGGAPAMGPVAISGSGGGKIVQYLHGDPKRPGYEPKEHWNHDHFSFTTRAAAVKAFLALKQQGYQPYEFEGYTGVGKHSATGGHYGPVGGKPTYNDPSDGTAFDIPYASYGSGPIGKSDYAKSLKAYQIVSSAVGGGGISGIPSADIAGTGQYSQTAAGLTPSGEGERIDIVIPDSGLTPFGGGGGDGGGGSSAVSSQQIIQDNQSTVLNNFVKNHLLVELAYL
jgi:hypothetical protein